MLVKIQLLFDDTVLKNNIKYAQPDASEKEIFKAAKLSIVMNLLTILKMVMKPKLEKMELNYLVEKNKDCQLLEHF